MLAALGERPRPMSEIATALQSVQSTAVAELAYRQLTRERARAVMFTPATPSAGAQRASAASRAPARDGYGARAGRGRRTVESTRARRPVAARRAGGQARSCPAGGWSSPSGVRRRPPSPGSCFAAARRTPIPSFAGPSSRCGSRPDALGGYRPAHPRWTRRHPRHVVRLRGVLARCQLPEARMLLAGDGHRAGKGLAVQRKGNGSPPAYMLSPRQGRRPREGGTVESRRAWFGYYHVRAFGQHRRHRQGHAIRRRCLVGAVSTRVRNAALVVVGDLSTPTRSSARLPVLSRQLKAPAWIAPSDRAGPRPRSEAAGAAPPSRRRRLRS